MKQKGSYNFFLFPACGWRATYLSSQGLKNYLYFRFRVGMSDLVVSHFQLGDSILLVVVHTFKNMWSIKVIFRGFEMTFGFWVNFFKSSLIGVNMGHIFLNFAEEFSHYEIENLPFKYFGLSMGDNPRFESSWEPLINLLTRKLYYCKHIYVSWVVN